MGVKKLLRAGVMASKDLESPCSGDGSHWAFGLEVEEELATMATQYWAEGVWTRERHHEQREAWMRQIQEVQMWRQVRGPAGAVMCETRDLGFKWSHGHTLIFSDETRIDMRFVCPEDVKKMLVQRARSVCWKKGAAKHEYEELKEGVWLEPFRRSGPKSIAMWPERFFWKEARCRKDSSTLAGRMQVSVNLATWRKAQKSTSFTTVQNGMKSGGRCRRPLESGSKNRERRRKSGSGKEVSSRTLSVEANGIEALSACKKVEVRKAQKLGHASRRHRGPCCHGRLFAWKSRKVESMWLGSGAVGLR